MADYCTAWPDGWPRWLGGTGEEWAQCCAVHDQFYADHANSLNWPEFVSSHWTLAQCVGGAMGATMFAGLCTFGLLAWISMKNKFQPGSGKDRP